MDTYRYDSGRLDASLRRMFGIVAACLTIAVFAGIGFSVAQQRASGVPLETSLISILGVCAIAGIIFGVQTPLLMRRQKARLKTFELGVSDAELQRSQEGIATARIARCDVAGISETRHGLTVRTKEPRIYVFIPAWLERYSEVRERLSAWRAIERGSLQRDRVIGALVSILLLGATWTSMRAPLPLAGVSSVVLWALIAWLVRAIRIAPGMDRRSKRQAILPVLLFALAPLVRLLSVSLGMSQ